MKKINISLLSLVVMAGLSFSAIAQNTSYWQQHVDYKMDVKMDVKTYQYKGNKNWCILIIRQTPCEKCITIYTIMPFNRAAKWMRVSRVLKILTEEWCTKSK